MQLNSSKLGLLSLVAIPVLGLGYFVTRDMTGMLLGLFGMAFIGYYFLIHREDCTVKELLIAGIVIRLMLLAASPQLSDDFYRFAFDGEMLMKGENPYTVFPEDLHPRTEYEQQLIENMNSPRYYTVYPPINQIFFSVPSLIDGDNVSVYVFALRLLIILFELLMALLLLKMLQYLDQDLKLFAWYFLNPLVIMELTGNLHFEGVTMFFYLLAIWLMMQGKFWRSAIIFGISVGTKLVPLMFLPFLIKRYRGRVVYYFAIVGTTLMLLFVPFINAELLENMGSSVDLYFHSFIFNASIFNLCNAVVGFFTGFEYNIEILGSIFPFIILLGVLLMALFEKNLSWSRLIEKSLFALLLYYAFASIVHPWYVINLVVLGVFTRYKFPYVWSALAILSYVAYANCPVGDCQGVYENYWLLLIEYGLLGGLIIYELSQRKSGRKRLLLSEGEGYAS